MAVFEPWTQFCVGSATATAPCTKFQPLTMFLLSFLFQFHNFKVGEVTKLCLTFVFTFLYYFV